MNAPLLVVACIAVSAGTTFLVQRYAGPNAPPLTVPDPVPSGPGAADRIATLEQTVRDLETRLRVLDPANVRRVDPVVDEDRLVRAVAARLGLDNERAGGGQGSPVVATPAAVTKDAAPGEPRTLEEFMAQLRDPKLEFNGRTELWSKAKAAGLADALLASYEERAKAEPNNPKVQLDLGLAYLNKMFQTEEGPAKWNLPVKADKAFDRALEIDERNWDARFQKAVSLSFWPPFLGKGPEAVKNFEVLLEQQKTAPQRPEFADSYVILGNLYDQQGKHEKALEVWRQGLAAFPEHADLKSKFK